MMEGERRRRRADERQTTQITLSCHGLSRVAEGAFGSPGPGFAEPVARPLFAPHPRARVAHTGARTRMKKIS